MTQALIQKASQDFEAASARLVDEFGKLQVGRASTGLVDSLMVEAYGSMQSIKSIASVSVPDAKTIQIQPWDRGMLAGIEKAIQNSDLSLNPVNNGLSIILNIPPLTEERRRDMVKVVNRLAEEAKISVRNIRHDVMTQLKKLEHEDQITEDDRTRSEKQLQEKVDACNLKIEQLAKAKEDTVMTV
jgi:ribosome recycling factor